jgi:hypothetical protein
MSRGFLYAASNGVLLACLLTSTAVAQKYNFTSYLGKQPPELVSRQEHWLGWHEQVTLEKLKGQVVWLQFNFWENCTSLRSHLVSWEEDYIDDGLIIVEINQTVETLEIMRQMVEDQCLNHPVLWDEKRRNTKTYGVTAWPFAYFIGADGKVFWEGDPTRWIRREKKIKEMRAMVEWELAWVKKLNAETDQRLLGLLSRPSLPLQVSRMLYRLREQMSKMMSVQNPRRRSR